MSMVLLMGFLLFLAVSKITGCLRAFRSVHRKSPEKEKEDRRPVEAENKCRSSLTGMTGTAFSELTGQVTELVKREFPEAKWIWEELDAMQQVLLGGEVHILLNRAGGYRRAKVVHRNLDAVALDFRMEKAEPAPPEPEPEPEEPAVDNYELLAFQWTEAHVPELSERCSEAASQGEDELLIPLDELPIPESWQDICRELARNEFPGARPVTDGIRIVL